jgi:5'-phosphate synthase pdxT subunit
VNARVGILGYQGCIEPHEKHLLKLGAKVTRVRLAKDLDQVDRLIIPGGESTTMLKFIKLYEMTGAIKEFAKHKPVWGICAGSILIADQVVNPAQESLKLINITAHRNYYGSQLDSFTTRLDIDLLNRPIEAHFIRAPLLTHSSNPISQDKPLKVHATLNDQPVFFSQGYIWACSFHIELGDDSSLHAAFLK